MKNNGQSILGIGNDIIEIDRIRDGIEKHGNRFLDRLFTESEQNYCAKFQDPLPCYAGRFAAKEAIAKAFGLGIGESIGWSDIQIINDEKGKPEVTFSDRINVGFNSPQVLVSISHCKTYATAMAIWLKPNAD